MRPRVGLKMAFILVTACCIGACVVNEYFLRHMIITGTLRYRGEPLRYVRVVGVRADNAETVCDAYTDQNGVYTARLARRPGLGTPIHFRVSIPTNRRSIPEAIKLKALRGDRRLDCETWSFTGRVNHDIDLSALDGTAYAP